MAKGTAGVEHAGEAERAAAAKSEALVHGAKGEAKHEVDAPLCKEGRMMAKARKNPKCKRGMMSQSGQNEGVHELG